jgi:hypothetical protein
MKHIRTKSLAAAFVLGLGTYLHAAERPNIVVILADDLGYGIVNSYGGDPKRVATPNIDRLAAEGAKFTEGYVTCSVCGPSRAALMTGRYQQRFGLYANRPVAMKLAAKLRRQGQVPPTLDCELTYKKDIELAKAPLTPTY